MRELAESRRLYEESRRYLAGGVSTGVRRPMRPFPLFFERGEGPYVFDVDGNRYVDFTLGWGPLVHGHCHPEIVREVESVLRRGSTFGAQHRLEVEVARRLTRLIPCADLVCFSNTGTEAVMVALRLARAFTGKSRIIKFEGHYHGWSDGVYVSYAPSRDQAGAADSPCLVAGTPGMSRRALADVLVAPWNDLDALDRILHANQDEVAAIIMEPYAFNTGVVFPQPGYIEGVRRLADKYGAVLVFDEVITGFRVGLESAQGRLGVLPDLAVFGKAVAGGFPLSVIAGRRPIMELVESGKVSHAGTFNGNPVVTAAAKASLGLLSANDGEVYGCLEALGQRLAAGLREAGEQAGVPVLVNQVGSVAYMHITTLERTVDYRDTFECDHARYLTFTELLTLSGVFTTWRGLWYLSTVHTERDIDEAVNAARKALSTLATS